MVQTYLMRNLNKLMQLLNSVLHPCAGCKRLLPDEDLNLHLKTGKSWCDPCYRVETADPT